MTNTCEYLEYLAIKRRKKDYIYKCETMLNWLEKKLNGQPPTTEALRELVKRRWCGYVDRDKNTFQILSDYANFCEHSNPAFFDTFNNFIKETFEGEARKAMKAYKDTMVFIPANTKISPIYLNGLTNDEFVNAFKALQKFLYAVYDAIGHGSPFNWGWPDWNAITGYGIIHNRVIIALNAMVECGYAENGRLVVDKKRFDEHAKKHADDQIVCKPPEKTEQLLKGLAQMGLHIEGLSDGKSPQFSVSFPSHPNVATVLCSYFGIRSNGATQHIRYFSYRFVEDPATQTHETFFLAKTDGEPEHLREIYYWLYDQAIKHGFIPTGEEKIFCYLYKKGSKEWLLLGKGSSYHEEEFLHSINYSIAAKFGFPKLYYTHPEKIDALKKRFPASFLTWWGVCHQCKAKKGKLEECKHRVIFDNDNPSFRCIKGYHYFHDPSFDDVKTMLELYKLENNIKPF